MVDISIVNASGQSDTREEKALKTYMLPNLRYYFDQHAEMSGKIVFYVNNLIFLGSTKDVDILMVADFENCCVNIPQCDGLRVDRFCTVIEAKSHDINSVKVSGQNIITPYPDDPKHNATVQCKREIELTNTFLKRVGISSWITGLIWLHEINESEWATAAPAVDNVITMDSDFERIIELVCTQSNVSQGYLNCAIRNSSFMLDIDRVFAGVKQGKSLHTIKTINLFSKEKGEDLYNESFKNGLPTILAGRAGTGKTISLLQLATYISGERNERCLFLTYNTALVSDIKRTLSFAPYIAKGNIDIFSTEKFIGDIIKENDVWEENSDYETAYKQSIKKCIEMQAKLKADVSYDYVFVDEAQDWTEDEKGILLRLFPNEKIIVADGIDQFVRGNKISWGSIKEIRKTSLRQKSNIVSFVNAYAEKLNLGWEVSPNSMLPGGKVNIYRSYNSTIHSSFLKEAKEQFCDDYDFLFLVPPSLSDSNQGFLFKNKYEERGIHVFDGTIKANRDSGYPETTLSLCRAYTYASCRGLEGWVTVCLRFDEMVEKMAQHMTGDNKELQAYMWSLIPLTRAVDILVLTVGNPDGRVGKLLKELSDKGFANWYIN